MLLPLAFCHLHKLLHNGILSYTCLEVTVDDFGHILIAQELPNPIAGQKKMTRAITQLLLQLVDFRPGSDTVLLVHQVADGARETKLWELATLTKEADLFKNFSVGSIARGDFTAAHDDALTLAGIARLVVLRRERDAAITANVYNSRIACGCHPDDGTVNLPQDACNSAPRQLNIYTRITRCRDNILLKPFKGRREGCLHRTIAEHLPTVTRA
mmetsp:Transcript_148325/g.210672  ORF Transcript_148325/g.210672 Transcript_148325/m.210672 type:complete len:214 (-) Transcript_148325:421-1062(-)